MIDREREARRRRLMALGAVGVACAAVSTPATAGAEAIGVVVVATAPAPRAPAEVAAAMIGAGGRAGDPAIDGLATARQAIAAGALPRAALERFRRTRALIDEGWRAYLQVAIELASTALGRARAEAEALLPFQGGLALYADVALRLGAVLAHLGRGEEADAMLRLAGWLDPERAVTTAEFSPDVVAAFDRARATAPEAVPVDIELDGEAGWIQIDGAIGEPVEAGATARRRVQVTLPAGQHVAVARAPGRSPRAISFAVAPPRTALSLRLEPDPEVMAMEGVIAGADPSTAARGADAIARYAEVDALVLVASVWHRGEPVLIGQRCAGEPVRCSDAVEVPDRRDGAADALWRALEPRGEQPVSLPSDARVARAEGRPAAASRGCRWCRSPWVWAGVGAVAVAVGVGVAIAATAEDGAVVRVDPGDFGGDGADAP